MMPHTYGQHEEDGLLLYKLYVYVGGRVEKIQYIAHPTRYV